MFEPGELTLSQLTPLPEGGEQGNSGVLVKVTTNNLTDRDVPEHAVYVVLDCSGQSGQTESSATFSFGVAAVPANGNHESQAPMQVDGGDWLVTATLIDAETNVVLDQHAAEAFHVAGRVHAAADYDGTQQHQIQVAITSVEHHGQGNGYRVHYTLTNAGDSTVPPGMLVQALLVDGDGGTAAWQDYHFEIECPAGDRQEKFLILEAAARVTDATAWITADPGGPSEAFDSVTFSTDAHGNVHT